MKLAMKHPRTVLSIGMAAIAAGTTIVLAGATSPPRATAGGDEIPLEIAKIYFEYNSSANDLGVHVFLDGEDWKRMEIEKPNEEVIFNVRGFGPYHELGMTELFFEGAEPSLDDVPLDDLLEMFPEGKYEFSGRTVDGKEIEGIGKLRHAIPAGPDVFADVGSNDFLRIRWNPVDRPPIGFPNERIEIVGYQVIVESFQVTVPASVLGVTVPPEFVGSLERGEHQFEVLAIDRSGNQTITEGEFDL